MGRSGIVLGLVVLVVVIFSTWKAHLQVKGITASQEIVYHQTTPTNNNTLSPLSSPQAPPSDLTTTKNNTSLLFQVARLLSPLPPDNDDNDEALFEHNFRFYVYDNLPEQYTPQKISECLENYGRRGTSNLSQAEFYNVHCDWSSSICSPQHHTTGSHYSDRRLNRNADAILARLFLQYNGPLRTFDPQTASLFIVPYPASSQKECYRIKNKAKLKAALTTHERSLLQSLSFWKQAPTRHLFLYSGGLDQSYLAEYVQNKFGSMVAMLGPRRRPGQLIIPYANTHPEYQPNVLFLGSSSSSSRQDHLQQHTGKRYALSAVLSKEIAGNGQIRKDFVEKADIWFPNNRSILDRPVNILEIGSNSSRRLPNESEVMQLYRDSIFCPIFRGDSPIQKRFFDVLLSGCIPVVMKYDTKSSGIGSDISKTMKSDTTSYFATGAVSVTNTYPFAMSTFGRKKKKSSSSSNNSNSSNRPGDDEGDWLGIDYASLVVEIPDGCLACIEPTLQDLLTPPQTVLRHKQERLAQLAPLFAYGMEGNSLQYPDAASALLLQAKYHIDSQGQTD